MNGIVYRFVMLVVFATFVLAVPKASFGQTDQTPPDGATIVTIVYPPEFRQLMEYAIPRFNDANRNPSDGTTPVFVVGFSSVVSGRGLTRSSGTVMEEILEYVTTDSITDAEGFYSLIAPELGGKPPTIWIPASSLWLDLINEASGEMIYDRQDSPSIARTAVVIAIWEDRLNGLAAALNKSRAEITMTDLLNVLRNGWAYYGLDDDFGRNEVRYGRTNPFVSSTGLAITLLEAYTCITDLGLANVSNGLNDILQYITDGDVQECLQAFRSAIVFNSVTTTFVEQIAAEGPEFVDFAALSEDDFLRITAQVREGTEVAPPSDRPLIAIYPSDGTFWADYPFAVPLSGDWVDAAQRAAALRFRDYLLSEDVQTQVLANGFRPVNANITLSGSGYAPASDSENRPTWNANGVIAEPEVAFFNDPESPNLPMPETLETVQLDWCDVKKRSYIYLVLDASGSMATQDKMGNALTAIEGFLTRVDARDYVGLLVFSGDIADSFSTDLAPAAQNGPIIRNIVNQLRSAITSPGLQPEIWGPTALFEAIREALAGLGRIEDDNVDRTIIILSNGKDNVAPPDGEGSGLSLAIEIEMAKETGQLTALFAIDYTEEDGEREELLNFFAQDSGGDVIDGSPTDIVQIFSEIGNAFATSPRCPND